MICEIEEGRMLGGMRFGVLAQVLFEGLVTVRGAFFWRSMARVLLQELFAGRRRRWRIFSRSTAWC